MKTILFIMGYYYPQQNANLNCCNNVIKELRKRGHRIIILCGTSGKKTFDIIDDLLVVRVHRTDYATKKSSTNNKIKLMLMSLFRIIHNFLVLPVYPNTEVLFVNRLFRSAEELIDKYNIDCVIGNVFPIASVCTIKKLCKLKKYNHIVRIGYYLDMLYSTMNGRKLPNNISNMIYKKGDLKIFPFLDKIILPEGGLKYYSQTIFETYRQKMIFANFPVFSIISNNIKKENTSMTKIIYAGYSNLTDRNPIFLMDCLNEIGIFNYSFSLYGRAENPKYLIDKSCSLNNIHYYGEVEKKTVDEAIKQSDIVVAFGNDVFGVIPSKIFELFGYKKRMIYIAKNQFDSGLDYVKMYPNKCILFRDDMREKTLLTLKRFFSDPVDEIEDSYLNKTFHSATTEFVVDLIEETLSDK